MSGLAKTMDKLEEKTRDKLGPLAYNPDAPGAGVAHMGKLKQKYGKKRNVDTSEGYFQGYTEKLESEAEKNAPKPPEPPPPMPGVPGVDDDLERAAQRKRSASRRQRSGRMSTILSGDTLG